MSNDHPLLEARHVDDLIQAVRGLNTTCSRMLAALERVVMHTQNLPALVALLTSQTNGHDNNKEISDAP